MEQELIRRPFFGVAPVRREFCRFLVLSVTAFVCTGVFCLQRISESVCTNLVFLQSRKSLKSSPKAVKMLSVSHFSAPHRFSLHSADYTLSLTVCMCTDGIFLQECFAEFLQESCLLSNPNKFAICPKSCTWSGKVRNPSDFIGCWI